MRQYERTIDVLDISANDLFIKTNTWFVETFVNSNDVIEFRDKEHGKIAGKYTITYWWWYLYIHVPGSIRQVVTVDIKTNKVKISIKDPYYLNGGMFHSISKLGEHQILKN